MTKDKTIPEPSVAEFIAELRALAEKATPGRWEIDYNPEQSPNIWIGSHPFSSVAKIEISDHSDGRGEVLTEQDFDDAAFIAASRTAIPRLIAMVEERERERDQQCTLVAEYTIKRDAALDRAEKAEAERDGVLAENARLRTALEWYGENARLSRLIHSGGNAGRKALNDDGGIRARAALAKDIPHD